MLSRANIFVNGLVQGVCYRRFAQINARNLGLNGWARNLYDGRVEVLVEGERGLIEELIKTLHIGPASADVKGTKVNWMEYKGEFQSFQIIDFE
ncbi:MAG: acylphosphatase [bacterium]|nr:acylphosphatase [bacterium]